MIIAIHESSHAVVAKILEDFLILSEVRLNNQNMNSKNSLEGTLAGTLIRPRDNSSNHCRAYCYVLWAGFIGENIYRNGWDFVSENLPAICNDPNQYHPENVGGDQQLFNQILEGNSLEIKIQLRNNAFRFLVFLFENESVWNCVLRIATAVNQNENQTLNIQELEVLFNDSDFSEFLTLDRRQFLIDEGFTGLS